MAEGNSQKLLGGEMKILLKIIQVYITCEGRYGRTMLYHFILLLHFTGKKPINMPYYLLKSLTKMASKVQAKPQKASNSLFHHGLIKLIVLEELSRRNKTWDYLFFGESLNKKFNHREEELPHNK
jgi:hypothetical protein